MNTAQLFVGNATITILITMQFDMLVRVIATAIITHKIITAGTGICPVSAQFVASVFCVARIVRHLAHSPRNAGRESLIRISIQKYRILCFTRESCGQAVEMK
jgi:hypothetical protein